MAVVVQQMVVPDAAGILFTADPATSNRKVATVEAGFGLGEALVSGQVNSDVYRVRDDDIVEKAVATKHVAIRALPGGGTQEQAIEPELQERPALTDAQVVQLAQLGRRIEAHFGRPQDIEWCLADGDFQIVQSRPITSLFPIPAARDRDNHVYVSVGPTTLVALILGNIENFEPGAGGRRFEQGRQEAWNKEKELLARLRTLPDGERKAEEARWMIERLRTFVGYREYPKYGMVSRYFVYK